MLPVSKSFDEERKQGEGGGLIYFDDEQKISEYELFKKSKKDVFYKEGIEGAESKVSKSKQFNKIVWGYGKEAAQILRNILETKCHFVNEEVNLGRS